MWEGVKMEMLLKRNGKVSDTDQRYIDSYYGRRKRKAVLRKRGNSHRCKIYKRAQLAYMRGAASGKEPGKGF